MKGQLLRLLVLLAVVVLARVAGAQLGPQPELRLDVIGTGPTAVALGGGVNLGAGNYQRLELDAGFGALRRDSAFVGTARVDALMRLMLDPFAERRWGLSLAGGVSARYDAGDKVRPWLVALLDLEGPPSHGVRTAVQLGVGGGVRLGIVLRRSRRVWR